MYWPQLELEEGRLMYSIQEFFIFSLTFCGVNEVDCANISLLRVVYREEQICYVNVCSKLFYNQTLPKKLRIRLLLKSMLYFWSLAWPLKRVGKKQERSAFSNVNMSRGVKAKENVSFCKTSSQLASLSLSVSRSQWKIAPWEKIA